MLPVIAAIVIHLLRFKAFMVSPRRCSQRPCALRNCRLPAILYLLIINGLRGIKGFGPCHAKHVCGSNDTLVRSNQCEERSRVCRINSDGRTNCHCRWELPDLAKRDCSVRGGRSRSICHGWGFESAGIWVGSGGTWCALQTARIVHGCLEEMN